MIIDALGLGESLSLHEGNNLTFGVNDIFKVKPVDYLVCVDRISAFTPERLDVIKSSNPTAFISHLDEWQFMPNFYRIEVQRKFPESIADLDSVAIPKSVFSPYVAIALAYKMFKPERIRVFGVDMVSHPHLSHQAERILKHWKALKLALAYKGCEVEVFGDGILI
jgi:hypothetical protein